VLAFKIYPIHFILQDYKNTDIVLANVFFLPVKQLPSTRKQVNSTTPWKKSNLIGAFSEYHSFFPLRLGKNVMDKEGISPGEFIPYHTPHDLFCFSLIHLVPTMHY